MNTEFLVAERRKRRTQYANKGTRKERFARYLYNKEDKTLCCRTPCGWFKVLCYYILFLAIVAALFFFLSWYALNGTMKRTQVNYKISLKEKMFPGVTFIGADVNKYKNSIIWYTSTGLDSLKNRRPDKYVKKISQFIEAEEDGCKGKTNCIFNNASLGPCSTSDYGFAEGKPCIFLKLGILQKWKPKSFSDVPNDLPDHLKKHINKTRNCVWVDCRGTSKYDKDHLGRFSYYPEPAFHEDYFPQYSNMHPVVALHLNNVKPGFVIHLQCELFADNIINTPNKITKIILYFDL